MSGILWGVYWGALLRERCSGFLSPGSVPLTRLILTRLIIGSARGCSRRPAG